MIKISVLKIEQNGVEYKPTTERKDNPVDVPLTRIVKEEFAQLLSVSEFAEEANISPQAVRKMILDKRIMANKIGNQHSIPGEELIRYLETAK